MRPCRALGRFLNADRPVAGTARASMKGLRVERRVSRSERCVLMQGNQGVFAPRRGLPAASIACRTRYARFTVAEDAGRGDAGFKPSGIRGMSDA